jgi:hypothetical protein
MPFELENTNVETINKLFDFAKRNQLKLSIVADDKNNYFLPGRPLSSSELAQLIERSRKSGSISFEEAHSAIRTNFNAD